MFERITSTTNARERSAAPAVGAVAALPGDADESKAAKPAAPKFRKKKTFQFSGKDVEKTTPLEEFEYPAYWDVDYPADFDNEMKHEVEKLQIFADFTPYLDLSWQTQIHPLTLTSGSCGRQDHVPMTCFKGLNKEAKDIVAQLAGPRYNANKKMIKIAEDRYNKRVHNHKRICDILRDLTQTALELSGQASEEAPKKSEKTAKTEVEQ
ncbi:Ribosomal protein S24/S35, mitochondrial, conserved domain [Phytophthora cactorum]|nr:Ribosomal protein S24/S35, mitochondrial, conserved domain [Phytophthora cactorum]